MHLGGIGVHDGVVGVAAREAAHSAIRRRVGQRLAVLETGVVPEIDGVGMVGAGAGAGVHLRGIEGQVLRPQQILSLRRVNATREHGGYRGTEIVIDEVLRIEDPGVAVGLGEETVQETGNGAGNVGRDVLVACVWRAADGDGDVEFVEDAGRDGSVEGHVGSGRTGRRIAGGVVDMKPRGRALGIALLVAPGSARIGAEGHVLPGENLVAVVGRQRGAAGDRGGGGDGGNAGKALRVGIGVGRAAKERGALSGRVVARREVDVPEGLEGCGLTDVHGLIARQVCGRGR